MRTVSVSTADGGVFDAWLALPPGGRGPGLLLLQEIFGVNDAMRERAAFFAGQGFVVLVPDLFWRQQPGVQLTDRTDAEWARAMQLYQGLDEAAAVRDAGIALAQLRTRPECTGRAGAAGWCLGGKLAYLLSARAVPDACVGYYGVGVESALAEARNVTTPLLLHIAGRDEHCPPAAQAQIHEALDRHPQVTLRDYPACNHAFARPGGRHFDAAAAELADLRTSNFLLRHLHAAPAPAAGAGAGLTHQQLVDAWEEHCKYEFQTRNTEDTLATMAGDAYVNHIPVLTGGVGKDELRRFYGEHFIPKMPPDTTLEPISRTVGADRVVDELIFKFTHTLEMDWMLPGIAPTGRRVEVPLVVIIHFRDGKLAHEHIYWDQASVLVQLGLLDARALPVAGVECAGKVRDARLPGNALMERALRSRR